MDKNEECPLILTFNTCSLCTDAPPLLHKLFVAQTNFWAIIWCSTPLFPHNSPAGERAHCLSDCAQTPNFSPYLRCERFSRAERRPQINTVVELLQLRSYKKKRPHLKPHSDDYTYSSSPWYWGGGGNQSIPN